jgi:hypothetical protein
MPTPKRRVSINLAEDEYEQLSALSQSTRLSMAWLGREALIEYLARHGEKETAATVRVPVLTEAAR